MVLVQWDTDSIKKYVFASSRLREIRGASAILGWLNEIEIPSIVGRDRIIYAGGGAAMAEVEDAVEAQRLINEIETMYRRVTRSAEITGAYLEMVDPNIPFGNYSSRLNYLLRTRKDGKTHRRSWRSSPVLKMCDSCAQYPAERRDTASDDDNFVCDSCFEKRQVSHQVRVGDHEGSVLAKFLDYSRRKKKHQNLTIDGNAPEDFTDIGEVASPKGYIGFIYCDGNRIGELLSELPTRDSYHKISEGIRDILHETVFDALNHHFDTRPLDKMDKKQILPFEIIFIGGDDLMLIVAADKAMEIALFMCREFAARSEELLKHSGPALPRKRLSLSAAVILAHASLPIYHLQTVADDLLKSAKRRSLDIFEEKKDESGCIDFHVVTASATELPSQMRESEWQREAQRESQNLTERPYTADELEILIRRIRSLQSAGFPTSKLQMLYEAIVDHSVNHAKFKWAFVAGRSTKSQFDNLIELFKPVVNPLNLPWRKGENGEFITPIIDVTELYDFVKIPKGNDRKTAN